MPDICQCGELATKVEGGESMCDECWLGYREWYIDTFGALDWYDDTPESL